MKTITSKECMVVDLNRSALVELNGGMDRPLDMEWVHQNILGDWTGYWRSISKM